MADPELSNDGLEELIAFITQSDRIFKPVTYLYPKGKEKEKMIDGVEIEVQKQIREAKERRKNDIFEAVIWKSHLFLIEKLSKMLTQVFISHLLLNQEA